ncbi:short-chain dehydrogenase [Rhizobium sp. Root1203]|uniref:oxidoreductase n=1 Tax=Rhizobium sp. Root1203 TaxID=1736427 RepID=UPI000708961D|nr:oxidoreductase [Rhizobium sp. Root1203]KQV25412.1 short-chain dehydrogenase [Rhizobium sp. Root1203]
MKIKDPRPVALVTGASSGMGREFALRLIAEGYIVYGAARRVGRMTELEKDGVRVMEVDLTVDESLVSAIQRVLNEEGRLDLLVNNAGYGQYGTLEEVPIRDARRQFETNLFGLARLVQLVVPHMRARRSGKIVNISSIGGKLAMPVGGWYHASKFALEGYSDTLRNELAPFGIDVIVIEPGGVETEWGGIAVEEARRHSASGAYSPLVDRFAKLQSGNQRLAQPKVIGHLLVKAIRAPRPATRYHGGTMAGPMLFLKEWLPDRVLDRVICMIFATRPKSR